MKKKILLTAVKYFISIAVGAGMVFLVLYLHGYSGAVSGVEKYRILCDAFTIPGVVLMLLAALVLISNQGFFDGIAYALGRFLKALVPFGNRTDEKYYDYKQRKDKQGRLHGYSFIFITGSLFFCVALIFMYLFYKSR